ncbi:Serine/threonine-protein kinase [Phytophthora megakarya]|uniref:Serine/threonine-protein kinase n=1 Tax=Phytophthora megakarya TaxID=4795 RepID=A0A225VNL5_9STRA|nr:Serine/threonine-protein kinase [Phytophthora megakarya]
MSKSSSSLSRLIHDAGITRKVLTRRAMHIKKHDVFRFPDELALVNGGYSNLIFLDEVSLDNRGMIRKGGYSLRVQTIGIRSAYQLKFFRYYRDFAYSVRGNVDQYPGIKSVSVLDSALIHRDSDTIHFLRSIGVGPIFLPGYCRIFNPIEFMIGYIKKHHHRHYVESSGNDLLAFVVERFNHFEYFSMSKVYEYCGWKV